jgi:sodium-dependent dicarboxylate transporter 2/3/5
MEEDNARAGTAAAGNDAREEENYGEEMVALEKTGLSTHLVSAIPFASLPPCLIVLLAVLIATATATVMSNTATANLLLPVIAALGASTATLADVGGAKGLIIATTLACSLGMALPISTPPNALAYATGTIHSRDLLRAGLFMNLVCLGLLALFLWALGLTGFFR